MSNAQTSQTEAAVCDGETHESMKHPSIWPTLTFVGTVELGGMLLEHRNCSCGSTLCIEVN